MGKISLDADQELIENLDDIIWELQKREELDRDVNRSEIIRRLMRDYVSEHEDVLKD